MTFTRRLNLYVPYAVAFILPLGFYGAVGVAIAAVYALLNFRRFLRLSWTPILVALPFAVTTVVSAWLSPDPSGSLPPAIGTALLLTLGLQAARLLAQQSERDKLFMAFLSGTLILAFSVIVDFFMGWNRLPSGLFRDPSLHNWAGALFALAFPLALSFARHPDRLKRLFSLFSLIILLMGVGFSLSWVGALGVVAGTLSYGLLYTGTRASTALLLSLCLVASLSWPNISLIEENGLTLRGKTFGDLQHAVAGRIAIFEEGVRIATQRPWIGWGKGYSVESAGRLASGVKAVRQNFLSASESFSSASWFRFGTAVQKDAVTAVNGSLTADRVVSQGVPGQRIAQFSQVLPETSTFTFSVWVKARAKGSVALAVRNAAGTTEDVAVLQARNGTLIANDAARFTVGDTWQRLNVTAHFSSPPTDGVWSLIYTDGYYDNPLRQPVELWGAQLSAGEVPLPYESTPDGAGAVKLGTLSHFHNMIVQSGYEVGSIGTVALIALLLYMFLQLLRARAWMLCSALVGFLTTQMFDYCLYQISVSFSLFVVIVHLKPRKVGP